MDIQLPQPRGTTHGQPKDCLVPTCPHFSMQVHRGMPGSRSPSLVLGRSLSSVPAPSV